MIVSGFIGGFEFRISTINREHVGTGEETQQLRALFALSEDIGTIPSTDMFATPVSGHRTSSHVYMQAKHQRI